MDGNEFVVPLAAVGQTDARRVGNKAATLGCLQAAGFPVPPGVCLTTAAFHLAMAEQWPAVQAALSGQDDPAEVEQAARVIDQLLQTGLSVPGVVMAALDAALPTIASGSSGELMVVRSSATAEDRTDASFAGQYATILGVETAGLHDAICACWRSFFSANALAERARHGLLQAEEGMAVLIQPLLAAECAGVCFSVDPVGQRRDQFVVSAAWGLGAGVVDGNVPADTVWLRRRDFRVEKQHIAEKRVQINLDSAGDIRPVSVPAEKQRAACLPVAWLVRIAQFALAAELCLGRPQDVEWAVADGQVWILQSRPLTNLPPDLAQSRPFPVTWNEPGQQRDFWQLAWYSGGETPPLPLEHDYIAVWESVREETCKALGADRNLEMRLWNGRAYTRRRPLDLTEADLQVRRAAYTDLQDRLQAQGLTTWDYFGPEVMKSVERLRGFDLAAAGGPALADHLEANLAVLRRNVFMHPFFQFKPRQPFFDALAAVSGLSGEALQTAGYQLLESEENILSRLVDDLFALAHLARETPVVAALVLEQLADVLAQLANLPEAQLFWQQLQAFLAVYGERVGEGYGSEMTILTPTWYEEPGRVLYLVAAHLRAGKETPAQRRARARQDHQARVEALCAECADQAAISEFRRQLAYARHLMTVLEEHNHAIEQVGGGRLRLAIMAAARWLVEQGVLTQPDDIFWSDFATILTALRAVPSGAMASTIQADISERQAQYAAWAKLEPPPILGVPPAVLPPRPPLADEVTETETPDEGYMTGIGASPGQTAGRARVVAKGTSLPNLQPGDILVSENAGPLWTPFFPMLGGLVLEEGSLGQHAAATAREYGLPAVIGVREASQRIPDGAWVVVDGAIGRVEIQQLP
jgi:rifampicin phosphotransferase